MKPRTVKFWAVIACVLAIVAGACWLIDGEFVRAGLNFNVALWAGMCADMCGYVTARG